VDDVSFGEVLDERLRIILPPEYQDTYDEVQPVSMGSAGLKYGVDGQVAWDAMWGSFCDLAMAGGPPHKGTFLEPGSPADIDAHPQEYSWVTAEICRGVGLVSGLAARPSMVDGWVRVATLSDGMAGWLLRAIVMENVAARIEGTLLDLPAAPGFRLGKEIKNVVTVIAKTSHYWLGHMPRGQQRAIANLFASLAPASPLLAPAFSTGAGVDIEPEAVGGLVERIGREAGLQRSTDDYAEWLGFDCPTVRAAIWMMRALVVSNVLSRREGTTLFVPLNPATDPDGDLAATALIRVHRIAAARGVV
jgi:sirohydrochlorin cobaltochelatase